MAVTGMVRKPGNAISGGMILTVPSIQRVSSSLGSPGNSRRLPDKESRREAGKCGDMTFQPLLLSFKRLCNMMAAGRQVMKVANADTRIIPGHLGPIVGFKEIQQQLEMFASVRDRVANAIRAGKTVEQVVASKPTADFDQGRMGGAITPDRFVTLVYTDLSRKVK